MRPIYLILTLLMVSHLLPAQPLRNEWIDYSKTYFKFPVTDNKVYRIPQSTLQAAGLGGIPVQDFQLWRQGEEVPIFITQATGPLAADGFLEIMGQKNDGQMDRELFFNPDDQVQNVVSYFTDTAWYYLTVNAGRPNRRMLATPNQVAGTSLRPDSFFLYRFQYLNQWTWNYGAAQVVSGFAVRNSVLNPGEGWAAQPYNNWAPLTLNLTQMRVSDKGPQTFDFAYSVSGNYPLERNLEVRLADSLIDRKRSSGYDMRKGEVRNLPLRLFQGDQLKTGWQSDNPFYWENAYVNGMTITYPRQFNFNRAYYFEMQLAASTQGNHLRMANFESQGQPVIVYDVTNNRRYLTETVGDSMFLLLQPSTTPRTVRLANPAFFVTPVTHLEQKRFTDFAQASQQGDYLMITSKRMATAANNQVLAYRDYRRSADGGTFNAQVYEIEELTEQFANGMRYNPLGIRNFVRYALANWSIKPRFVFLIGRAAPYEAMRGLSAMPEAQIIGALPSFGSPASDNLMLAADNVTPIPMVPVGRLSAITNDEVGTYLDKVKQYEALVSDPKASADQLSWKKEAVHLVGGDDPFLANIIGNFFNRYRQFLSDTSITANVGTFRRVNNPNFANDMASITRRINQGAGIITYFGHSSSSGIDFNLVSPEEYKNTNGRYPLFIANGCRAGNIFDFNFNRIQSKNQSISENFILAKNKGAITFISNSDLGVVNYMHLFTNEFYRAISRSMYGRPIGEIQREAVSRAWALTGNNDLLNRSNLEQVILHSDPAVIPYPFEKADYSTDSSLIKFLEGTPDVSNDSVWVQVKLVNVGRSVRNDSVTVEILRETPDGRQQSLGLYRFSNLFRADSVRVRIGLKGLFEAGTNFIVARIDPSNEKDELSKENNLAKLSFQLNSSAIVPVFPFHLSIVNQPNFRLTASTVNPAAKSATYRVQVDTSRLFNSPSLVTNDVISIGGAVQFNPGINWRANTVYYWRTSPVLNGVAAAWSNASFLYQPSLAEGSNPSHYFQHLESSFTNTRLSELSRRLQFENKLHNVYVEQGIWPTSGTEEAHFSVIVNGARIIRSACIGQSIMFNVFDGKTMKPWDNSSGGRFGSAFYCGAGREFNFEFNYFDHTNRKRIVDFLDAIPTGDYVIARLILDPPYDSSFAQYWQRDTLIYGKGNSLYHRLKAQGFYNIDSLNKPRTFSFIFRKNDSLSFAPAVRMSEGVFDRIHTSESLFTLDTTGRVSSPVFGPAAEWKSVLWDAALPANPLARTNANMEIWGVRPDGSSQLITSIDRTISSYDASGINAAQYPFLQLRLRTGDTATSTPVDLRHWRITYTPVPDGALSARDFWQWSGDSIKAIKDSLKFGIAFRNVSAQPLPATNYRLLLGNANGQELPLITGTLKALTVGDTARIRFEGRSDTLQGKYYLRLEVNNARNPVEESYFNNLLFQPFVADTLNFPVEVLGFTATPATNGVQAAWNVSYETKVNRYEVLFGTDSLNMQVVLTRLPLNAGTPLQAYGSLHGAPIIGRNYYRLRVIDRYGNVILSPAREVVQQLLTASIAPSGNAIGANWQFRHEMKLAGYQLQHSANAGAWADVANQSPRNDGALLNQYQLLHTRPSIGNNRYRLRYTDAYNNAYLTSEVAVNIFLSDFAATGSGKTAVLNWEVFNELNIARYDIEWSQDSSKLQPLAQQVPTNNAAGTFSYNYTHTNPPIGYNYYRVKMTDGNGNIQYTATQRVFIGDAATLLIFPNPMTNVLRIVTGDLTTNWQLQLFDAAGKLVIARTGIGPASIPVTHLVKGTYFLHLVKGDQKLTERLQKL